VSAELSSLLARLQRANAELARLMGERRTDEAEFVRLMGERDGVSLAIGYVEDALRGLV
jgi:hypothetical protein